MANLIVLDDREQAYFQDEWILKNQLAISLHTQDIAEDDISCGIQYLLTGPDSPRIADRDGPAPRCLPTARTIVLRQVAGYKAKPLPKSSRFPLMSCNCSKGYHNWNCPQAAGGFLNRLEYLQNIDFLPNEIEHLASYLIRDAWERAGFLVGQFAKEDWAHVWFSKVLTIFLSHKVWFQM